MKFQMLALGARFEFEGKEYVKTGPLTAMSEGKQRMIPRFAILKPLDTSVVQAHKTGRKMDEAVVLAAFEAFMRDCTRLFQATKADDLQIQAWLVELDAAREQFLAELSKSTDAN